VGLLWGLEMVDAYSRDDLRAAWIAGRDAVAALFDAKATWHREWQRRHYQSRRLDKATIDGIKATDCEHEAQAIRAMTPPDDLGRPKVGAGNE